MPLNRYQIRNEYSLADPELYKAADKDDPEALLEGVAMAGLVGVLRQLGDLAEFAAEIFHDLHEEVMATAARGHSLTVRVQQLEAEFPLIERAFLSQTNHSSFFYNAGTDWHPNMRMDQNMVTQGDLPRFVMDSYEECRGPPRLFLLDKFDVAGAGACLKRYTDPSFFKVETSSFAFTTLDVQREREKKTRKTKKRGSRWRNGETPEVLPTSHAKLHQLFLEERIENGIKVPAHRVKLKRKMNGFPFDPKSGKSYMNKFLEATSPEHKVVHEISIDSSPLRLPSADAYETMMDTEESRPPSPDKEVMQRKKIAFSSPSPPQSEDSNDVKPCLDGVNEDPSYDGVQEICIPRPSHNIQSTNIVVDEKEIAVDGENRIEGSVGYESDDVASEVDNYVDALATMDSELDTDSEQRAKRNLHFLNSKRQVFCSSSSSEKLQAQSSDSTHSMENSTLSDDGNSYSKKEISTFSCSDSPSVSVESVLSEREISGKEAKTSDTSYDEKSVNEETQLPQPPENGDYDNKCIMVAGETSVSDDPGEPTTSLIVTDSTPMPIHANAGIFMEGSGMRAETNEKFVTDDKSENPLTSIAEETTNLHVSPSGTPDLRDDAEQDLDDSPSRASVEDNLAADDLVDGSFSPGEKVSYASYSSNELPWSKSPKIQHESKSDNGHMNMVNNLPFTSELQNVPSQDTRELLSSDNQHLHNLDGEDPSLGEDSTSLYNLSDGASSIEDDSSPSLLDVNLPNHQDDLNNENSNGINDASVQVEDTCMKKPHNVITTEIEAGNAEEEHEETHGAFSDAATFEQGDLNKNYGLHGPDSLDAPNPQISEIANYIQPLESGTVEISCSRQENLVEASSLTKFEEEGNSAPSELLSARPSIGLITSPHLESLTNKATFSDETENKIDRSDVTDETASLAALADKGDNDDVRSSFGHSSQNELELDHIRLPDCLAESKFEKPVADSPDSNSFVHDTSNYHHPKSEVLGENTLDLNAASSQPLDTEQVSSQRRDVTDSTEDASFLLTVSHLEEKYELENNQSIGAENTLDLNAASRQPLDTEQVSSQRRDVADSTEDASYLQTVCLEEEKNELEDNQLNEELMDKADVNVDQSSLMEQMQPSSHIDGLSDASSQSLLANLPSHDAVPDVLADSSDHDPQPSLTDYCAEERAESTIYEHNKMEALDSGEAKSEPLPLLPQPQQVDSFDLEQSAEASSICLPMPSPSQPSFPELLSQNNQDNLSSLPTHHPDKEEDLECKELDTERLIDQGAAEDKQPQFDEAPLSNHVDIVGALNASMPFIANIPSQPSVSNPLPLSSRNVNPFEQGNTMISTSPGVVLLPGEPQIDLAEMPPLPPLPPIQWRMGKLHSSPDLDEEPSPHHIGANLSSLVPRTYQNVQPVNHNMALPAVATESAEHTDMCTADYVAQSGPLTLPPTILHGNGRVRLIDPVDKHSMNPYSPLPGQYHEKQQPSLHGIREKEADPVNSVPDVTPMDKPSIDALGSSEDLIQSQNQVAPEMLSKEQGSAHLEGNLPISHGIKPNAAPFNTGLADASGSFSHELSQPQFRTQSEHHPVHQLAPETSSNRSNLEEIPTSLERNVVNGIVIIPSYTENAKPDHSIPTTEADIIWPAVEEGNTNGIRSVKLQRPRTPLIDDLATHDKSKLRKVTERVRPEVQKDGDRDSLLEPKLRKVTERVRPEVQKDDDRDSLLEQKLRKVTERVRPEVQKDDDRDSLLEQIRKKSFNLKPTVATRPSIQGPQTNLRVAAILEKAKTIRQAFAGSDEEDDEDSWSDS